MKYEDMSRDELIKEVESLSSLLKSDKSDDELKKTIQELQAGQIKLEEENRELRKKRFELEEDRKRCREIYDFAHSDYCAIDELILAERNKLKSILDSYPYGIYIVNQQYDIEYINPVIEREFGQIMNRKCFEYFHNLKEPCQWCKNPEVFSGKTVRWEWTGSNGKTYDLFDMPFLNANGSISKLELFYDITERKKIEEKLKDSETRVQAKLDAILMPEGNLELLELGDIIDIHEIQNLMNDFFHLTKIAVGIIDLDGKVLISTGWQDICSKFHRVHKETLKNCIESDTKLSSGVEPGTFKIYRCKNNIFEIVTPIIVGGKHMGNLFLGQFFFEDEKPDCEIFRARALQYGFDEKEYLAALDRVPLWSHETINLVMSFYMSLLNLISKLSYSNIKLAQTLVERRLAEDARRKSEERLLFAMETIHVGIWDLDLVDHTAFRSLEHDRIFGYTELLPQWTYEMFLDHVLPEDRTMVDEKYKGAIETVRDWSFECRIRRTDGELRWIWAAGRHQIDDTSGSRRMAGIVQDITERKKAEEEREKLQNQLLHSQKMESVGRLAGGVAHDFNNILGIIISISELIAMDLAADDPLYDRIQQIINSSDRAAKLVGQLLAFARKQTVSPRTVDINETISSMIKILHRIIGEDIELIWSPGYNPGKVIIDPTQIDQILANLVINSRDAIPGIGSITLATENVVFENPSFSGYEEIPRGEYVMLAVSDTGSGISKEVMKNIFEPFFTTKEVGKGTGLGLATVYGIVRQNNGYINIYSEEGKGTVFRIYLPCIKSENPPPSSDKHAARPDGGTEIILVAEDEEDYLLPFKVILEKLGYTVITAKTPHEAINLAENYAGNIHLLVTDVIMPEMSGKDLMERLHTIRPDMKCLYMSGYTADIIAHHGVLEEGVKFIEKPFSIKTIAKKVREVLD
ncbi:MAG: PocR ligand-binding domain-containing protein [Candidatus Eremiobacterota bacterium]